MTSPTVHAARPTPLWAVNAFSFINSLGTGVITNGIFFITKSTYQFSETMNYFLGVVIGLTYIVATLLTGRVLNRLRASGLRLTERKLLVITMVLMALMCTLPLASIGAPDPAGRPPSSWPIWVMVALYIPLTGVLWPLVESYVSGGRHGNDLRRAMGLWNFVWSSAIAVGYWGMTALIEKNAPLMILILGSFHLVAACVLATFTPTPPSHGDDHQPHPPVYEKLLVTFRILLPLSYILHTALQPFLPSAMTSLGITLAWQPLVASVFAVGRAVTFGIAGRLHIWHGRWSTPIVGVILLLLGFTAALLSPLLGNEGPTPEISWTGILVLCGGLAVFATGMALNYTAAIYYAMAVGKAEVDAGGKHEALIGVGYTVGPLCGLVPSYAIDAGWMQQSTFAPFVLVAVGIIAVSATGLVVRRVFQHA
ncbi:MAG TPA: MFS transporter [Phycisphaerales bacterium]|nr:MFS transporter [Phycisphaerales bacterium]